MSPCTIIIGRQLSIARKIAQHLSPTLNVRALITNPDAHLSTALHLVHPAPSILVVGGGFTEEQGGKFEKVFEEFQREEVKEEDIGAAEKPEKSLFVKVPPGLLQSDGEEGVAEYIKERVREKFSNSLAVEVSITLASFIAIARSLADGSFSSLQHELEELPPVMICGKHRSIALDINTEMRKHRAGDITALYSSPFSSSALATSLRLLYPPPRALLCGGGYDKFYGEAERVFREFREEVGEEGETSTFVGVPEGLWKKGGQEGVVRNFREQVERGLKE